MTKPGPKESEATRKAIALYESGEPAVVAAYKAKVNPATLYRALKRRKERK